MRYFGYWACHLRSGGLQLESTGCSAHGGAESSGSTRDCMACCASQRGRLFNAGPQRLGLRYNSAFSEDLL